MGRGLKVELSLGISLFLITATWSCDFEDHEVTIKDDSARASVELTRGDLLALIDRAHVDDDLTRNRVW